jgi:hypothetical protein
VTHVSDQDFFFDEEPESKGPGNKGGRTPAAPSAKTPSKSSAGSTARSTQPAPRSGSRQPSRSTTPPPAAPSPAQGETTWAIAALLAVAALLLGAICGFLLGNTLAGSSGSAPVANTTTPAASTTQPSVLTTAQIQSGQLPAGHPSINSSGSAATTGQ